MREEFVEAIAKLIELTQAGKVRWQARLPDESLKIYPDDKIGTVFETRFQGRKLRLYRRTYKLRDVLPAFEALIGKKEWSSVVKLEFVTEEGAVLWSFPSMPVLDDLLSAVQYQTAGVEEFVTTLLKN